MTLNASAAQASARRRTRLREELPQVLYDLCALARLPSHLNGPEECLTRLLSSSV